MRVEGPRQFLAGEAIANKRLVKLSGSSIIYADAGDDFIGVSEYAISNAEYGAVRLKNAEGTFEVTASGAITAGVDIFAADDGKVSMTPGGKVIGQAIEAATADGDIIEVILQESNLEWQDRVFEAVSDDKTLDVQDNGKAFYVTADAKTITLPATLTGLDVIIINGGADAAVAVNISPNANDLIAGPDIAGADNKDLINTKATAIRGDFVHITDRATAGYIVKRMKGTWAQEA